MPPRSLFALIALGLALLARNATAECTYLITDSGCDVPIIQASTCGPLYDTNTTFDQYLQLVAARDACECAARAVNGVAVDASNVCIGKCPKDSAPCAGACIRAYESQYSALSRVKCGCYAAAEAACVPRTPVKPAPQTTPSTTTANATTPTGSPAIPLPPPTSAPSSKPTQCSFRYQAGTCPANPVSRSCLEQGKALVGLSSPITNGCGADDSPFLLRFGLAQAVPEFRGACNAHDRCFGTCSGGEDSQFDSCNSALFADMRNVCADPGITPLTQQSGCLGAAFAIYSAVQLFGCSPYDNAQNTACSCIECNVGDVLGDGGSIGNGGQPSQISFPPLADAIRSTCTTAFALSADWPGFKAAVRQAIAVASPTDSVALAFYAGVIGSDSARTSPQVQALGTTCGQQTRRRSPSLPGFRRQSAIKLSSFFVSIGQTDPSGYACTSSTTEQVCQVSNALIALAGVSRGVESYADDTVSVPAGPSAVGKA